MSLAFKRKPIVCERWLFKKVTTHKLRQNANFENGGTAIQIGILHVLINVMSIFLLSMVHEASCYFEMQKD